MIPKRVWLVVLVSFLCHGLFVLSARYRFSYDAYTHMLFANHYAEGWFSLWEPRWYTGFTVVSYPPLAHQLVALFIPILGFDKAFALVLWVVTSVYPLGVYAFSRIFAGKTASAYAALASALLLPIYVTAYVFGQFPFLTSTLFSLFGAASLNRYLRQGGTHNLLLTVSLYATMMASHHATLIVQPFWAFAVVLNYVLASPRTIQWRRLILRLLLVGVLAITFGLFVIWPFWQWGTYQTMQTPIDHLSRHNFFTDPLAFAIFFFPLYGPLAAIIPFLFRKWHPRFIGLLVSFTLLFLLGLGGTTPLPRLFFGSNWEWLTYDRFAFWAGLTLTPFFGILFIRLKYSRFTSRPQPASRRRSLVSSVVFSIFTITVLGSWFQPILQTQPAPLDMKPIVDFLNQDDRSQWRYLTFGFGNQFAYLNLLTTATTIDGSYHTVRTLPELRESGIAEVDTAYWALKGISAIGPILEKSGEHGVRWGFVNRAGFIPELRKNGWVYRATLSNKVQVWENPDAILPKPSPPPETNPITAFSWGVLPIISLITTLSLGGLRVFPLQTERILQALHAFMVGLVPVSICFWYYFILIRSPFPRVYFTYTNVLIFFADAFMISAVLLWGLTRLTQRTYTGVQNQKIKNNYIVLLFFMLALLSSLSVFWSLNPRTSLYVSFHFWLVFLFSLSIRDWHESWKIAIFGFCAALTIEAIAGFVGFAMQSTEFLQPFKMEWPGILDPSIRGASVVQLADGLRVLRAYGTLPHPNLLGGFALITLLGTSSLFLSGNKPNYLVLTLHIFGVILIGISFSRSAWLGFLVFVALLSLKTKTFNNRKYLWLLITASLLTMFLTLYFMRDLVFTRIGNSSVATENLSTFGRVWLTEQAVNMLVEHPWTGVGIGSFIIELASYAVKGAIIEPVHNLFLLAGSELGLAGLVLVVVLFVFIVLGIFRAKSPQAILASATLAGLGVISLFDHYIWTLAPGRAMLGLTLGLWLGRISDDS